MSDAAEQGSLRQNLFGTQPALLLAPMARTTDGCFRMMCREMGAQLTFTEMAIAKGIVNNNPTMYRLVTFNPDERPIGIQLTGKSAHEIANAVRKVCESHRPELIDVNAGCPVPNICSHGCGAALLNDADRLTSIVRAAVQAADGIPVSIKLRVTPAGAQLDTVKAARIAQEEGAFYLTLHAGTPNDTYAVKANWDHIAGVKAAVSIPVVGNGDIFSADDAVEMVRHTGVDGVMVARGALGQPWIFDQIRRRFAGDEDLPPPKDEEILAAAERYVLACFRWNLDPNTAKAYARKHLSWFIRRLHGARHIHARLFRCCECDEFLELLADYKTRLLNHEYDNCPCDPEIETLFRHKIAFWRLDESDLIRG